MRYCLCVTQGAHTVSYVLSLLSYLTLTPLSCVHPHPPPRFDGRPADFAISRFTFYECSKCNRPFFGGARACHAANPELARAELVCGGCSVVTGADGDRCRLHDANFIEWKCK